MRVSVTPLEEKVKGKPLGSKLLNRIKGYGTMLGTYILLGGGLSLVTPEETATKQFFGNQDKITTEIGEKETAVFGTNDETTGLNIIVGNEYNNYPLSGKRVIISNGTIADTLLTDGEGVARFINSAVTDVEETQKLGKKIHTTTTQWPQVSKDKFTMYAYYGQEINEQDGTIIGEGIIYNILTEEVAKVPITVKDNIAIMHHDGTNLADGVYIYSMPTEYGIGKGKILKSVKEKEGAFNGLHSTIIERLDVYEKEKAKPTQASKVATSTDVEVTIESLVNDFNQIELKKLKQKRRKEV